MQVPDSAVKRYAEGISRLDERHHIITERQRRQQEREANQAEARRQAEQLKSDEDYARGFQLVCVGQLSPLQCRLLEAQANKEHVEMPGIDMSATLSQATLACRSADGVRGALAAIKQMNEKLAAERLEAEQKVPVGDTDGESA